MILRYIRCRTGNETVWEDDAIAISKGSNIIIDHCSASWGTDETLSATIYPWPVMTYKLTIQWCMITESLYDKAERDAVHGHHGMGSIIEGHHGASYTWHHNLWAHHRTRCPKPESCVPPAEDPDGLLLDFRNNVIYHWDARTTGYTSDSGLAKYNFINNYYVSHGGGNLVLDEKNTVAQAYFAGNYMNGDLPDDQWSLIRGETDGDYRQSQPFDVEYVTTETAPEAYSSVLAYAGASHARDSVDARVVKQVASQTGGLIADEQDVGGWPKLNSPTPQPDTDRDGMPDAWEKKRVTQRRIAIRMATRM